MSLVVSAPGKVLLAGGYLVLDPKYSGIVVSTSSRFYTIIRPSGRASHVQVRSPQFINGQWEAKAKLQNEVGFVLEDVDSGNALSKNKFVYLAVQKVFLLVSEMKGMAFLNSILALGLDITIVGDNDFYSQRAQLESRHLPPTINSLGKIPPFVHTNVTLGNVHKTGLGSSAALITSLVTALLVHFSVITASSLEGHEARNLAHNVAQYVHCLAQGKVGSGFDVSAAVFGSHIYTRFDPAVLAPLMSENESEKSLVSVLSHSNHNWRHTVQPFRLPPGVRLMLADVDAGSDTPSLVGRVLQWRRENPSAANELWDSLSARIGRLAAVLAALTDSHTSDPMTYNEALGSASGLQYSEWPTLDTTQSVNEVAQNLMQVRSITELIRNDMREMGLASGVPIEPKEQTRLLDACLSGPGVVAGGVPGAGGYDAIWLLVLDPQTGVKSTAVSLVEELWGSWTELNVSPLSAFESQERGVRIERLDAIPGLSDVLTMA